MPSTSTGTHRRSATSRKTSTSSGKMDALKLLKQDHRAVEELFDSFDRARTDSQKQKLASEICTALKAHTTIEEEIFYPAARAAIEDEEIMDEAQVEHNAAKQLIAEIEKGPQDEMWEAKVKVLGEYIKHHVKEEEGEMFKEIRATDMDLEEIGAQLMQRKQELTAGAKNGKNARSRRAA